jgi:hypothetical protein
MKIPALLAECGPTFLHSSSLGIFRMIALGIACQMNILYQE